MTDNHEIIPLQSRVRNHLFEQWLHIMNYYEEYVRIKRLGSEDSKSRGAIIAGIKKIVFELNNYTTKNLELKFDKMEDIENSLREVSSILFRLGVIDARMEKPKSSFVVDW